MRNVLAVLLAVTALVASVWAEGLLEKAWTEYEYQNFGMAQQQFSSVLKGESSSEEDKLQARLGLAMITHYEIPGGDPDRAIEEYEELINSIPAGHKLVPNINLLIGRAYRTKEGADFDMARDYLQRVITLSPGTNEADQAVLEQAYMLVYYQTGESFNRAIKLVRDYLEKYPDNILAATMWGFCANLTLAMGEFARAREFLIKWDAVGVTSRKMRPVVAYQIARLSEAVLADTATAIKYYREVEEKYPWDNRMNLAQYRLSVIEGEKK